MSSRALGLLLILLSAPRAGAVTCEKVTLPAIVEAKCRANVPNAAQLCSDFGTAFVAVCQARIQESRAAIERLNGGAPSPARDQALAAAKLKLDGYTDALMLSVDPFVGDPRRDDPEAYAAMNKDYAPLFDLENLRQGIGDHAETALKILGLHYDTSRIKKAPASKSLVEEIEKAIKAPPQQAAEIISRAGEQALAGGRTDDAEALGEALVRSAPNDARGPSLLAEAALAGGRPADAERWAQKALELNPNDKKAKDALSFARAELSAQKLKKPVVENFSEARMQDLANGLAAAALPPRPSGTAGSAAGAAGVKQADAVPRVLAGLLRRGYEKMNLGDLPGAIEDVSVHIDSHPEDPGARLVRAEILLKLGKPGPALADIDTALAKTPDDPRALRARAAALYELGRDGEALTTIERALTIEPASGIGHLTRAKILERLNRVQEAVEEYKTAGQLDPTLEPVVEAALRRLGAAPPAKPKGASRFLLRGGLIVVSLGLILLGLVGGAVVATRRARAAEAAAAAPAHERTLKAGDLVAGQYRITRELGRGGMGVVFEAVDETLKRSVALKQLQGEYRASAEDAARFLQEARLVAQLRHPNVAEIYAAVEDGGLYLVFELVRGRSLDAVLGAGVTPEQARGIVAHACAALTAAHARRIVHRDLKPSNLMLSDDGMVKVMDFGIAHQSVHGGAFTQTSASGTPPYMAPEQALGSVSAASDLYALGVMAYELLAGVRPFEGPDFLGPKMRGEFAPVTRRRSALPAPLDAFFASALSPDPARRPRDAAAFAAGFAACWS